MATEAQLRDDLTAAMRAKDEIATSTLRLAIAAIRKAEVAGDEKITLADDAIVALLATERKKRLEAADAFAGAGRAEQAAKETSEAEILARYLPADLDDAALDAIVAEEVASAAANGQTGPKAMGNVIKAVRARAGATADGARIAAAVKAAVAP